MNKSDNLSTALLNKKEMPTRLIVDEREGGDNSCILLSPAKMDMLFFSRAPAVLIKAKTQKETVGIVLPDDTISAEKIRMNGVVRKNLGVSFGDVVAVSDCSDLKHAEKVHILPFNDTLQGKSAIT